MGSVSPVLQCEPLLSLICSSNDAKAWASYDDMPSHHSGHWQALDFNPPWRPTSVVRSQSLYGLD